MAWRKDFSTLISGDKEFSTGKRSQYRNGLCGPRTIHHLAETRIAKRLGTANDNPLGLVQFLGEFPSDAFGVKVWSLLPPTAEAPKSYLAPKYN